MRKLYRAVSCFTLEILIYLWATLAFINFIGWAVRLRRLEGWEPVNMKWYDTALGIVLVVGPVLASVCFMFSLLI